MRDELVDVLIQFQLSKLETINLGIDWINIAHSRIGEAGVSKLVGRDWASLKELNLSK